MYLNSEYDYKILMAMIFFDDIIFGGHELLCKIFADEMKKELICHYILEELYKKSMYNEELTNKQVNLI